MLILLGFMCVPLIILILTLAFNILSPIPHMHCYYLIKHTATLLIFIGLIKHDNIIAKVLVIFPTDIIIYV